MNYFTTTFDEDRDPMEAPGASVCGLCGLYPIMAGERHDCPDSPPPATVAHLCPVCPQPLLRIAP